MNQHRTFSQKLAAGFAVMVILTVTIGAVAVGTLRSVVASKDQVINVDTQLLIDAERLRLAAEQKVTAFRTFLLNGDERELDRMRKARADFVAAADRIGLAVTNDEARRVLDALRRSESEHQQALERVVALRQGGASIDAVVRAFDAQAAPKRDEMDRDIAQFTTLEEGALQAARAASADRVSTAVTLVIVMGLLAILVAAAVAALLTRTLGRQIGTAVGRIQTSSAELEAAASQQATGAKEEATAMSEITTTINELLATSRQISDSARRVAQIAADTAGAANSGDSTIEQAQASIAAIRRQVDLIVGHMLELGKNSQQVGAVLDIVSELAEQTNILAINATIEASGAGESGRRFAVVADEIRKLADRVAGSAKEIRALIDDVRGAVNTTVMATETGSKAVDAGSRQFAAVADAFQQIAGLVATTTDAAREIELSTKQQATAVEQVNVAVADVAEATRATEASSAQTSQTASQLAGLSTDLLRLVHAKAGG